MRDITVIDPDCNSPRHKAALDLAAQGIPIFPCRGKQPATEHGFKSETTDAGTINGWWAQEDYNIGVRPCHMGLVAIDLDHAKPNGVSQAVLDMLPPTRTHRTPSGGEHRLYLSWETFGNAVLAVNVDVRSANGYILWPPSEGYSILDDREPEMLPEPVAAQMRTKGETEDVEPCDDTGIDADYGGARLWCASLAKLPDYDRFALAAGLVRNFGLTDTTATKLCEEYGLRTWAVSSSTTWQTTLRNARKFGKGKLGKGVAFKYPEPGPIPEKWKVAAIAAATQAQEENTTRRFRRRRPSEAKDQPPMIWLDEDNLFPSGPRIMVIYAEKENLKTQFALAKCLEIVGRTDGRVLYIAAEDGHGIDTSRLPAYVEKRGVDWETLDDHWWPISEPIDLIGDSAQLIADVTSQRFKPTVVVIDVMTACTGAVDFNMPGIGNALMNAAQQIANGFGALVVLLTHPGKDADRGPVGSYAFTARADVVLSLKRQGDTLAVSVEKMKSGPSGKSLAFAVESHKGIPLICARRSFASKGSATDDDAILIHLAKAGVKCFEAGLSDRELAKRIVGEQQPGEDGAAFATRVARLVGSLRKRHKTTRYGESATMSGGNQLYWRWHHGPKVDERIVSPKD